MIYHLQFAPSNLIRFNSRLTFGWSIVLLFVLLAVSPPFVSCLSFSPVLVIGAHEDSFAITSPGPSLSQCRAAICHFHIQKVATGKSLTEMTDKIKAEDDIHKHIGHSHIHTRTHRHTHRRRHTDTHTHTNIYTHTYHLNHYSLRPKEYLLTRMRNSPFIDLSPIENNSHEGVQGYNCLNPDPLLPWISKSLVFRYKDGDPWSFRNMHSTNPKLQNWMCAKIHNIVQNSFQKEIILVIFLLGFPIDNIVSPNSL